MIKLYDYWRSSAAYRVRIALNLKGVAYEQIAVDLRAGSQRAGDYLTLNPQGLVPFLDDGALGLGQSLAIMEHLEEVYPEPPLLPSGPATRAKARAVALAIACDIHPLNNLRVLHYLERQLGLDEARRMGWYRHWIATGFDSVERMIAPLAGSCCLGDAVTMADVCLVPQVYNAKRYECDLAAYPTIRRVNDHCQRLEAFAKAAPQLQPDA